jgi:hypothetical protein
VEPQNLSNKFQEDEDDDIEGDFTQYKKAQESDERDLKINTKNDERIEVPESVESGYPYAGEPESKSSVR